MSGQDLMAALQDFDSNVQKVMRAKNGAMAATCNEFSWEAKRRIALAMSQLCQDNAYHLLEILAEECRVDMDSFDEPEIDIDSLSDATLHQLQVRSGRYTLMHRHFLCSAFWAVET
jgi:hypothetical protein